jgi:hypothetical protein
MKLLQELGDGASGLAGVEWASFVVSTLRELSVRLCRGNFLMYRAGLGMLAKCSGTWYRDGNRVHTDEYDG